MYTRLSFNLSREKWVRPGDCGFRCCGLILFWLTLFLVASSVQGLPLESGRYGDPRWKIAYGSYEGTRRFAVNELQRVLQQYLPYVIETRPATQLDPTGANVVLVGTAAENRLIAELEAKGLIQHPRQPQSYTIACVKSPWQQDMRVAIIDGADESGVLFGAVEFNKRLSAVIPDDPERVRSALDSLPFFSATEAPVIENRGLWTWGYVIYDYRRFLDNMARLKMNRLTIWNDTPPINSKELIQYAHDRGIQVIFGFHWGWGTKLNLASSKDLATVKEQVIKEYEKNYRGLGLDGIYFQTLTEHNHTVQGGRSVASLAARWVNEIAAPLLRENPRLRIEFGLHATSIQDHYPDLRSLDPRIVITWEDAGVTPYSYEPGITVAKSQEKDRPADPSATIEYSKKIATFRPGSEFAMIAKGWTTLRWNDEFEHHAPFILGERSRSFIFKRAQERQPRWDSVNARWMVYFPVALRFFCQLRQTVKSPMTVQGLIEDGLLEERIQPSAALLGEMLWNPTRSPDEYLRSIFNSYLERTN
jgi:hypothetical protein